MNRREAPAARSLAEAPAAPRLEERSQRFGKAGSAAAARLDRAAGASSSVRVVVMGPSGCGKSTLGAALARALVCEFVEGDVLHPPENVARMTRGIALTDADRAGWLAAIAARIETAAAERRGIVVACSALKRSYRDVLRGAEPALVFLHLAASRAVLAQRLAARADHYMPATLLDSQLATLEPPAVEENAFALDGEAPAAALLQAALDALAAQPRRDDRR